MDNMVRNMSFSILTKEPKTLEQIFHRLIKRSDALSSYLQHYKRLPTITKIGHTVN